MTRIHLFFIPLFLFLALRASSQETPYEYSDPEEGFEVMRRAASAKDYKEARLIGHRLLEDNPAYYDVSVYLARVYAWELKYDSGYAILNEVLEKVPGLPDAHVAYVDLCYWENDWEMLETVARDALNFTDSEDVRAKYALALYKNGKIQQSLSEADTVLAANPDHTLARNTRKIAMIESENPEVFGHYSFDYFQEPWIRRWHMLTVGGVYPFSFGKLVPYINAGTNSGGDTFSNSSDIQFNLESYIILGQRNYMLAGYGISPGKFFPRHNAILEVWQILPAGFAVSAGARYFYWDSHFIFWSLGIEKYLGDYWFALKNYLFHKDYGFSSSHYLTGRRYFGGRHDYLSLTLGYGTAPDEPVVVISDLDRLNAASLRIDLSKQLRSSIILNASAGYAYEEFQDSNYRNRFNFRIGSHFILR